MAHMIDSSNGRSNIAFVGETPWHGLGQSLTAGATLETWTREAGLNFLAHKSPVQYHTAEGMRQIDGDVVIYRDDTMAPLGIVGAGYKLVQPVDVMELFRDLTERHGYQMETAGSLKGGRIVWALARGPEQAIIGDTAGRDTVGDYLLCSTSFDGTRATVTRNTTVRVVCNNTLTLAEQGKGGHRVKHRSNWSADAAKAALRVGAFAQFADEANRMANKKIEPAQAVPFLLAAYHGLSVQQVNDAENEARKGDRKAAAIVNNVGRTLTRLSGILDNAPGQNMASTRGTLWGLVNAVTYDVDHEGTARTQENRLDAGWFGKGDTLKSTAYASAVQMLSGHDSMESLLQMPARIAA